MTKKLDPFNLFLLSLKKEDLKNVKPVTSFDIYDQSKVNFHPDGLFSTEIFGRVGSQERETNWSYIDLKVPVFNAVMYRAITKLKQLYAGIMSGKEYAVWDKDLNDFVKSNAIEGDTGYAFFMRNWKKINFLKNNSNKRSEYIDLVTKHQKQASTECLFVICAGLRDLEIKNGRPVQDEINALYRKAMAISNTLSSGNLEDLESSMDTSRYNLQMTVNAIYDYLANIIGGKHGYIMAKFLSRNTQTSSRNVITAVDYRIKRLGDPSNLKVTDTVLGLYQSCFNILPVTINRLRSQFLSTVFESSDRPALLVNPKTLKSQRQSVSAKQFNAWNSREGLEKLMSILGDKDMREQPIKIDGLYLGLSFKAELAGKKVWRFIHGLDDFEVLEGKISLESFSKPSNQDLQTHLENVKQYFLDDDYLVYTKPGSFELGCETTYDADMNELAPLIKKLEAEGLPTDNLKVAYRYYFTIDIEKDTYSLTQYDLSNPADLVCSILETKKDLSELVCKIPNSKGYRVPARKDKGFNTKQLAEDLVTYFKPKGFYNAGEDGTGLLRLIMVKTSLFKEVIFDRPWNHHGRNIVTTLIFDLNAGTYSLNEALSLDGGTYSLIDSFVHEPFDFVYTNPNEDGFTIKQPERYTSVGTEDFTPTLKVSASDFKHVDIQPITYAELFYQAVGLIMHEYPLTSTRYPVAGMGSTYPSYTYLMTTVDAETRTWLNNLFTPVEEAVYTQVPVRGSTYVDSASPHPSRLAAAGGDFDGDMMTQTSVYTEEAKKEIKDYFNTTKAYLNNDGSFVNSASTDLTQHVARNLLGDPK